MRVLAAEDNFITRLDLRERPDIAFLDFSMPGSDGLQAARRILAERSLAIVMVTGRRHADLVAEAAASGIGASFLAKPFSEEEVLAAVKAAEKLHRQRVRSGGVAGLLRRGRQAGRGGS